MRLHFFALYKPKRDLSAATRRFGVTFLSRKCGESPLTKRIELFIKLLSGFRPKDIIKISRQSVSHRLSAVCVDIIGYSSQETETIKLNTAKF